MVNIVNIGYIVPSLSAYAFLPRPIQPLHNSGRYKLTVSTAIASWPGGDGSDEDSDESNDLHDDFCSDREQNTVHVMLIFPLSFYFRKILLLVMRWNNFKI